MMKFTEWRDYHTNNNGEGLWNGGRQVAGTIQFSVRGCKTEKAAKAKIRKWVKENQSIYWGMYEEERVK